MNDNGSDQHLLLSASRVPDHQQSLCCSHTLPTSSLLVFDGWDYQYAGQQGGSGAYAEGLFTLRGGVAKRFSPKPKDCGACSILDYPGALTPTGRVVWERGACTPEACDQAMYDEPVAGGTRSDWTYRGGNCFGNCTEAPAAFSMSPRATSSGELIAYPQFFSTAQGAPQTSAYLAVGTQAGKTALVVDQPHIDTLSTPAWSPDDSVIVDVDGTPGADDGTTGANGFSAGLWAIGVSSGAALKLLSDPSPSGTTFANPVFVGSSKIVFEADNNLWSIPVTCRSCGFPARAKRLTSDGSNADPIYDPTWTSATVKP